MKKVLVVFFHGNLFQPKAGNEIRVHNLVRSLTQKYKVITLESSEYRNTQKTIDVEKRYFFNDLKIRGIGFGRTFANFNLFYLTNVLKVIYKEWPDIIQVEYPYGLVPLWVVTNLLSKTSTIIVYDAPDVELDRLQSLLQRRDFNGLEYLKHKLSWWYCRIIEKVSCTLSDCIFSVSEIDRKKFCSIYPIDPQKIFVVPSGATMHSALNKLHCRKKFNLPNDKIIVVFHGSYDYFPNREAINLIEKYIAPSIYRKYGDSVIFVIAGKNVPRTCRNNIIFLGFVNDIYELLYACDIAICPILSGGGTRLKIMDYMCVGLPIVSTKKGIEGIDIKAFKHVILCNDAYHDFVNGISYLIENTKECKKLKRNEKKIIEKNFTWEIIGNKLKNIYSTLCCLRGDSND